VIDLSAHIPRNALYHNTNMIRVNVLYPRKEGAPFNWDYYIGTHMPLVSRRLGGALLDVSVEQGVAGGAPGTPPAFIAMAHLTFQSAAAFEAAFTPHAAEIMGDIPNYTTIEPLIQISDVKIGS
jgi:uncharacterized protein (TIGR02118 family)